MRIIVNADDLGISQRVNEAVFQLMDEGRVTSATMMANGQACEGAADRLRRFPHCSFGMHLNLTDFRPLTKARELMPLLDQDGCFTRTAIRQAKFSPALQKALFEELCAQVEKVKNLGVGVSHLDGHHHVHTVPALFEVLKNLQSRFRIQKGRIARNIPASSPVTVGLLRLQEALLRCVLPSRDPVARASRLLHAFRSAALMDRKGFWNVLFRCWHQTTTTDGFASLEGFMESADNLPSGLRSVELMVHPGADAYETETELLRTAWWKRLPFDVTFITYDEL
ncbi:MAG: carbohydrate deacetylase [Terriglobia bacterium]